MHTYIKQPPNTTNKLTCYVIKYYLLAFKQIVIFKENVQKHDIYNIA